MKISVEEAVARLKGGDVVAIPTETVYGLAACVDNAFAINKIYALKGRPSNNPLIIHLADADQMIRYVKELPKDYDELTNAFWPGPLTLVLPVKAAQVLPSVRAHLTTAAFRVPSHALAREVIKQTGPLVMPSANLSGTPSSTSAHHVEADFGINFPVLDGGECSHGVESTILYWSENKRWKIIRLGAISALDFEIVLGYLPEIEIRSKDEMSPICPGQMYRHYAPKAHLHLIQTMDKNLCSVILGFDDRSYPKGCIVYSLGNSTDPKMCASRLYAILRKLDHDHIKEVYVDMDIPETGLWITLKERLIKAANG